MTQNDRRIEALPWTTPDIPVVEGITSDRFFTEIVPRSKPVVMRGLVANWPCVRLAQQSAAGFVDHVKAFDTGLPVDVMQAPPGLRGRFFYSEDLHDFNFVKRKRLISETLDQIIALMDAVDPEAVYMGSVPIGRHMPGFAAANPAPFALPMLAPRIWMGGAARVQTHFDPVYNLACNVAGRRRFVVFPPEQLTNLYIGPFELTLAGAVVSLASLEEPDFERFPRLKDALATASSAILEPGDALFLPHYWFHHVTALEAFNAQVNYWWGDNKSGLDNPRNSFLAALLGVKDLNGDEMVFWKTMFEHYVFQMNGDPVAYIPEDMQSAFGKMSPKTRERIRKFTLSLINE